MAELITDQIRAILHRGESVEILDPATDEKYVLIRREEFERMRRLSTAEEIDPSFFEVEQVELFDQA